MADDVSTQYGKKINLQAPGAAKYIFPDFTVRMLAVESQGNKPLSIKRAYFLIEAAGKRQVISADDIQTISSIKTTKFKLVDGSDGSADVYALEFLNNTIEVTKIKYNAGPDYFATAFNTSENIGKANYNDLVEYDKFGEIQYRDFSVSYINSAGAVYSSDILFSPYSNYFIVRSSPEGEQVVIYYKGGRLMETPFSVGGHKYFLDLAPRKNGKYINSGKRDMIIHDEAEYKKYNPYY